MPDCGYNRDAMSHSRDALLRPYLTNLDRPVYALRNLPEEVIAVLFAYYSRSTDSLRDNLHKLLSEGDLALQPAVVGAGEGLAAAQARATAFHEKWVVGYGHGSVAEHAVVHLAVEDLSIVATKVLEDNRLASYTEKSTRYVPFDEDSFHLDADVAASPQAGVYTACCRHLLRVYTGLMPTVISQVEAEFAKPEDWTDRRYRSVCRAKAFDLLRYLLPAATRTNVGLTINARALEHLLTKLYSHPLAELRALAASLRAEAEVMVPTLLKYAAPNEYLTGTRSLVAALAARHLPPTPRPADASGVRLVSYPAEPLADLAAAILYEASNQPWEAVRATVAGLLRGEQAAIINASLTDRGRFDVPPRALEHLVYCFEVVVDFGAWRDIQRHRLCTQSGQPMSLDDGYATPHELERLGHAEVYHAAQAQAAGAWRQLAEVHGPDRAQYVLPLAWRKRILITMNLRELHHFISLRSGRQGHPSYRRIAQQCWHELNRVHPELARHVRVDLEEYALARG